MKLFDILFFSSVRYEKINNRSTKTPIPMNISNDNLTLNFDEMYINIKPEIIENIEPQDMTKINEFQSQFEELKTE